MYDNSFNSDVRLLTVKECAARLHCAPATVYAHIQAGQLVVTRIGAQKGFRIDLRDLEAFISLRKFSYEPHAVRQSAPKLKHLKL